MIWEIGGSIPLSETEMNFIGSDKKILKCENLKNNIYTFSARSLLDLLLKNIYKGKKNVLLPSFTCTTCITPFINNGFVVKYYTVKNDLTIDKDELESLLKGFNFDCILYIHSYFGFDTIKNIKNYLNYIYSHEKNVTIIDDFTHSWLRTESEISAHFYLASVRKWFATPDGGVLASNLTLTHKIDLDNYNDDQVEEYITASKLKNRYLDGDNSIQKEAFYPLFKHVITYFRDDKIYGMSSLSKGIYDKMNYNEVRNKRRENALYLADNINNPLIQKIVTKINGNDVPFYYPVLIKESKRNEFQKYLASNFIYCPIHWSIPEYVLGYDEYIDIYKNIISLVCDQRYTLDDMKKFVEIINNFQ